MIYLFNSLLIYIDFNIIIIINVYYIYFYICVVIFIGWLELSY